MSVSGHENLTENQKIRLILTALRSQRRRAEENVKELALILQDVQDEGFEYYKIYSAWGQSWRTVIDLESAIDDYEKKLKEA